MHSQSENSHKSLMKIAVIRSLFGKVTQFFKIPWTFVKASNIDLFSKHLTMAAISAISAISFEQVTDY